MGEEETSSSVIFYPAVGETQDFPSKPRYQEYGVVTLHSRTSASFAVFLHYTFLATSTAAPLLPAGGFSLKGSLEKKLVCWPLRYKSKAQPVEPHL